MKAISIPKLELRAALLATRLKDDILKALIANMNHVYMWKDSTTVLQWLNTSDKLPVFFANCVTEILKSTAIDEWHQFFSGNNPADPGTRGISSEALKDSIWVFSSSVLRTTNWTFIPDERVINKFYLNGPFCDVDDYFETSSFFVTDVTSIKNPELGINWETFSSITSYKRVVAFILMMLLSNKYFRDRDLRITDPAEFDFAENKLFHLVQMEFFPVEVKTINAGKLNENSSKSALNSPFIGPAGIIRSTGRIVCLVNTKFHTKHPILLYARHTLVVILVYRLHHKLLNQGLHYPLRFKYEIYKTWVASTTSVYQLRRLNNV